MFCSKCGAENPEDAKVCSKCGAELAVSVGPPEGEAKPEAETSIGLSANVAGLLCYVLGWITGIIFLVMEDKSKFVKFHAWQSIMTFGVLSVVLLIVSLIPIIGPLVLVPIVWILMLVLWIILMIQAGSGKMWKLPWAGNWAEKQASK
jgi:uncharacterized membrane protein